MQKTVDFGSDGRSFLRQLLREKAKIANPDAIIASIEATGSNRAFGGASLIDNPHTQDITHIHSGAVLKNYGKYYRSKDWAFRGSQDQPGITICMAPSDEDGVSSDGVILETKLDGFAAQKYYFAPLGHLENPKFSDPGLDTMPVVQENSNAEDVNFNAVITKHPQTGLDHIDMDLIRTIDWWTKFGDREMPKPLTGGVMKIYDLQELQIMLPEGISIGAVVCVADEREDRYLGDRFTPEEMGAIVAMAAGLPETNPNYRNGYPGPGKLTNLQYMFNDADNTYKVGNELDALRRRILDCAIHFRHAISAVDPSLTRDLEQDEVTGNLHENVLTTQTDMPEEYKGDPVQYLADVRAKLGSAPQI